MGGGGVAPEVVSVAVVVVVQAVVLGVGHGLGVKGREVLARGHWRAEAQLEDERGPRRGRHGAHGGRAGGRGGGGGGGSAAVAVLVGD